MLTGGPNLVGPEHAAHRLRLPGAYGVPLLREPSMVDCRRVPGKTRAFALGVLSGVLVEQPTVTILPAEKVSFCHIVVDVMGKRYEADAYGKPADMCGEILAGSKVRVTCDLVQHPKETGDGKQKPVMGLRVRHVKVRQTPSRGLVR